MPINNASPLQNEKPDRLELFGPTSTAGGTHTRARDEEAGVPARPHESAPPRSGSGVGVSAVGFAPVPQVCLVRVLRFLFSLPSLDSSYFRVCTQGTQPLIIQSRPHHLRGSRSRSRPNSLASPLSSLALIEGCLLAFLHGPSFSRIPVIDLWLVVVASGQLP